MCIGVLYANTFEKYKLYTCWSVVKFFILHWSTVGVNVLKMLHCKHPSITHKKNWNVTYFLELDVSAVHKGPLETEEAPTNHVRNTNIETAHQIQSLLTEIGSNNLVTSAGEGETTNINFHPCPWCSGRLITVWTHICAFIHIILSKFVIFL